MSKCTWLCWAFDDGNGNTTTATQNVIVDDITAPVTPVLADVEIDSMNILPTSKFYEDQEIKKSLSFNLSHCFKLL